MKRKSGGVGATHRLVYTLAGDRVSCARGVPDEDNPTRRAAISREAYAQRGTVRRPEGLKGSELRATMSLERGQE
jgi:hypothetical protein